eukprot:TRINITY_DN24128_c0_g5_i1.p1 TRINITY_DN24128_c0_g5~~TRINITY_DN24128_c0_g5_i1.p1  ORF type:complete len:745 (+),score=169.38 TRINITY_DN24128_c0_g5_i1:175-2409(+)
MRAMVVRLVLAIMVFGSFVVADDLSETSATDLNQTSATQVDFSSGNPIAKVLELLNKLEQQVKDEESTAKSNMKDHQAFCERRMGALQYEIKTLRDKKQLYKSRISKTSTEIEIYQAEIKDLLTEIRENEVSLNDAEYERNKENKAFKASEKDLVDTMGALSHAIDILRSEASKAQMRNNGFFIQMDASDEALKSIEVAVTGSMMGVVDSSELVSLIQKASKNPSPSFFSGVQTGEQATDGSGRDSQPVYVSKNGKITSQLEDLASRAQMELQSLRKRENDSQHNYNLFVQKIEAQMKDRQKEVDKRRVRMNEQVLMKEEAEENLKETETALEKTNRALSDFIKECNERMRSFRLEAEDRTEELKAVAQAKDAIGSASGSSAKVYGFTQTSETAPSFVQVALKHENSQHLQALHSRQLMESLQQVAKTVKSQRIILLSARVTAMLSAAEGSNMPEAMVNVIRMIKDSMEAIQKELEELAVKRGYCESEQKNAAQKLIDLQEETDKLAAQIELATTESAKLKIEVQKTQEEVAVLAETRKNMTKIRRNESRQFRKMLPEIQGGLASIRQGIKALQRFYQGQEGRSTAVLTLLEVCEADFLKSITEMKVAEKTASEEYQKQEGAIRAEVARKETDIKYKTKKYKQLDVDLEQHTFDQQNTRRELVSVKDFVEHLKEECKLEKGGFKERMEARELEIDGLKEALSIIDEARGTESLVQIQGQGLNLRGGSSTAVTSSTDMSGGYLGF